MDKFIGELKNVKNNINFLNQAHLDLESSLLRDSPMLTTLRDQLCELTIHSKKYEVDNFIRALSEARKRALETKKQHSSMEKLLASEEDISESSLTSSFSELEIYKGSPPPPKKLMGGPGQSGY